MCSCLSEQRHNMKTITWMSDWTSGVEDEISLASDWTHKQSGCPISIDLHVINKLPALLQMFQGSWLCQTLVQCILFTRNKFLTSSAWARQHFPTGQGAPHSDSRFIPLQPSLLLHQTTVTLLPKPPPVSAGATDMFNLKTIHRWQRGFPSSPPGLWVGAVKVQASSLHLSDCRSCRCSCVELLFLSLALSLLFHIISCLRKLHSLSPSSLPNRSKEAAAATRPVLAPHRCMSELINTRLQGEEPHKFGSIFESLPVGWGREQQQSSSGILEGPKFKMK